MYTPSASFPEPPNVNMKLWRYMDFTQFVSMLASKSLYFTTLARLQDEYEGILPVGDIKPDDEALEESFRNLDASMKRLVAGRTMDDFRRERAGMFKAAKEKIAVNCWHANEDESAAMWRIYLRSNEGIAIQSTYKRLASSFIDETAVYIGPVSYINYATETLSDPMLFFLSKRRSFDYEREIRAMIMTNKEIGKGMLVPVKLATLIEKVYVAPTCEEWCADVVEAACKKYRLSKEVERSSAG